MYPRLEIIIASHNHIRAVNFSLNPLDRRDKQKKKKRPYPFEKLKRLDLSYNLLDRFPNITACNKLRKLYLQGNFIKDIGTEDRPVDRTQNPKLMEINLYRNQLYLPKQRDLMQFIQDLN